MKTSAARLPDGPGTVHELREHEADPAGPAAETVARQIGLPPQEVLETLVTLGDRRGVLLAAAAASTRARA